ILSQKKGRRHGEGHQKAPQISACPLPLAGIHTLEEGLDLPGLRPKRNAWYRLGSASVPLRLGECTAVVGERCTETHDGLSWDEATKISSAMLLLAR